MINRAHRFKVVSEHLLLSIKPIIFVIDFVKYIGQRKFIDVQKSIIKTQSNNAVLQNFDLKMEFICLVYILGCTNTKCATFFAF